MRQFTSVEICAGAGGQALGLELAGFHHLALVEIEAIACETLLFNRPEWNVVNSDVREFSGTPYVGLDLLSGGVPCPPFSVAGMQLGQHDERDLFPEVIRLAAECEPKAIMIENVKGILQSKFDTYRESLNRDFENLGYHGEWKLLNASDFGVPQLRPRAVFVAFRNNWFDTFQWPQSAVLPPTVADVLYEEMNSAGWEAVDEWAKNAKEIAPTLVGGSKKHGGPDLGPTRAKRAWAELGVDGHGIAYEPPKNGFVGKPKLTVQMAALIQGFPRSWIFAGKKTPAYRQVGNAFPPPVAKQVGLAIRRNLERYVSE